MGGGHNVLPALSGFFTEFDAEGTEDDNENEDENNNKK